MPLKEVICLCGLIFISGCCHTVPTDEFVDPRFNLTLMPYSKIAWTTTLRPHEIKQSNLKGTVLTKKCVLSENKIGFIQFICEADYNKQKTELLTYEIEKQNEENRYYNFYPNVMVTLKVYDKENGKGWEQSNQSSYYITDESLDLLHDKEEACTLKK